jgi:hypothetical protein
VARSDSFRSCKKKEPMKEKMESEGGGEGGNKTSLFQEERCKIRSELIHLK